MAPVRGASFHLVLMATLVVAVSANLSPQQQFQQQQLLRQQQTLHCETIRLQNQAMALKSLPMCGGFSDFDFATFTSTKAEFGNFCASYCSVHQGLVKWQEKVFYSTQAGKNCKAPVDTDVNIIAAYWCSTAADGSYFKTLFSDSAKGVPTCAAIQNLDEQCKYQLKEALDVFASAALRQRFQGYFNQCKVAYPPSPVPAPAPLLGAKIPSSPVFREPAINFVSGGQTCPDGSPPLGCTEQDCARSSCPRYPGSQCVADQCDKCLPKYNEQVGIPNDLFGWGVNCSCPDGSLPKTCSPSPCSLLKCPAYPEAYCLVDTCYGCNAVFMVNGTEVDCRVQNNLPEANVTVTANVSALSASLGAMRLTPRKAITSQTSYAPPPLPPIVNPYAAGQKCPNGQAPPVTPPASACNATVCSKAVCGRYPTAQCVADECDGCKAKYNLNVGLSNGNLGWEVTPSCSCPDGSQPFTRQSDHPCIPDPCQFLKCQNFPTAFCVSDLCNGCNAVFLLNGQEVDCGNQVRFPGNVTGASTIQQTQPVSLPPTIITPPTTIIPNPSVQSSVIARTFTLITAIQQGNLTAILPLVTSTSVLYAPGLPGPLGYDNVSVLAPFLNQTKGTVSNSVVKSYLVIDASSTMITEEFAANKLGNMYATLLWINTTSGSSAASPYSWQLQYAALTPAPNGPVA